MSESNNCYVHLETDPFTVLFQLPPQSREMHEGNIFTYTPVSGPSIVYKIESVDYRITQLASQNENNPHDFWKSAEVYYGVSIVP